MIRKIYNFLVNELFANYFIVDAYDHFGNKINHKICRNFIEKEITVFIFCIKYHFVRVI